MTNKRLEELRQAISGKRRDRELELPPVKRIIVVPDGIRNIEDFIKQEIGRPEISKMTEHCIE